MLEMMLERLREMPKECLWAELKEWLMEEGLAIVIDEGKRGDEKEVGEWVGSVEGDLEWEVE